MRRPEHEPHAEVVDIGNCRGSAAAHKYKGVLWTSHYKSFKSQVTVLTPAEIATLPPSLDHHWLSGVSGGYYSLPEDAGRASDK